MHRCNDLALRVVCGFLGIVETCSSRGVFVTRNGLVAVVVLLWMGMREMDRVGVTRKWRVP